MFHPLCLVVPAFASVAALNGTDTRPAAAAPGAPVLTSPADGATLTSFSPSLAWTNPAGVTQYHLQVTPARNDGPGIDLQIGSGESTFRIPPPPVWYGLLPDMTYTWRVRVSDAPGSVSLEDPSWGPWAAQTFRTPAVSSSSIAPLMPADGEVVRTLTPVVQWDNSRSDVFYYELQLSKDPAFNTNAATATAAVHWPLLHGGVTRPAKSYAVPSSAPLEDRTTYFWRVRPRVQGDGTQVAWSPSASFRTDITAAATGPTVQTASVGVGMGDSATCQAGGAAVSFHSAPLLTGLGYAYWYAGSGSVVHNWYRDDLPISDSAVMLKAGSICQASSLGQPGGGPDAGSPLRPGSYRLEVWAAGQLIQTTGVTVLPSPALAFGPITVGTGVEAAGGCTVSGAAASFVAATTQLYARFNSAGTGEFGLILTRDGQAVSGARFRVSEPARCWLVPITLPAGASSGSWSILIGSANETQASATFTVE